MKMVQKNVVTYTYIMFTFCHVICMYVCTQVPAIGGMSSDVPGMSSDVTGTVSSEVPVTGKVSSEVPVPVGKYPGKYLLIGVK